VLSGGNRQGFQSKPATTQDKYAACPAFLYVADLEHDLLDLPHPRAIFATMNCYSVCSYTVSLNTSVLNFKTSDMIYYVSTEFNQGQFQDVLRWIRTHWRDWQIVLFVDKHSAHIAGASQHLADELGIELRWQPTAGSELNPVDHLWRHVKKDAVANQPTPILDEIVQHTRDYIAHGNGLRF